MVWGNERAICEASFRFCVVRKALHKEFAAGSRLNVSLGSGNTKEYDL